MTCAFEKQSSGNAALRLRGAVVAGLLGAIAVCIGMTSPAEARAVDGATPAQITIQSDPGGSLYDYAWRVAKASARGSHVRIRGKCQSACTLYLAMPPEQVCIYPGTSFYFHRAYGASRAANQMGTDYMYRTYPEWVRTWIKSNGGLSNRLKRMNFTYASQFVQPCSRSS